MNKGILIGRIGKDAEVQKFEGGAIKVSFTLATSERFKDKNGNKVENTDWHNIQMWGERAERLASYLLKGTMVMCEGKIKSGMYKDQQGVTKFSPYLEANNVEFLSKSETSQQEQHPQVQQAQSIPQPQQYTQPEQVTFSDDLPF